MTNETIAAPEQTSKTADGKSELNGGLCTELQIAFVQGVAWWEERKTGGTIWASDRNDAEAEAFAKLCNGTLGKVHNVKLRGAAPLRRPSRTPG